MSACITKINSSPVKAHYAKILSDIKYKKLHNYLTKNQKEPLALLEPLYVKIESDIK
jgi:hypothetical protein